MPVLRLFAQAREAAGTSEEVVAGATLAEVLNAASVRFGPQFVDVLGSSRVWVNGEPVDPALDDAGVPLSAADEVAVLPPVSGGT